ncbi:MAG: Flp family type IVb pilin [Pirellulales bacterium]
MAAIKRFLRDDDGTTAVEYAVMLAMVLLAMLATIASFGGQTGNLWGNTNTKLTNAGFGS